MNKTSWSLCGISFVEPSHSGALAQLHATHTDIWIHTPSNYAIQVMWRVKEKIKTNKRVQRGQERRSKRGRRVLEVTRNRERVWGRDCVTDGAGKSMFIFTERRQQPTSYNSNTQTFRHNELYVWWEEPSSPAEEHHLPTQMEMHRQWERERQALLRCYQQQKYAKILHKIAHFKSE